MVQFFQTKNGFGTMAPALGEGKAVATALNSLAQQPDASATITRTLFVGLAMIESLAIYVLVIVLISLFPETVTALPDAFYGKQ